VELGGCDGLGSDYSPLGLEQPSRRYNPGVLLGWNNKLLADGDDLAKKVIQNVWQLFGRSSLFISKYQELSKTRRIHPINKKPRYH